jgi:hypothetical protein
MMGVLNKLLVLLFILLFYIDQLKKKQKYILHLYVKFS